MTDTAILDETDPANLDDDEEFQLFGATLVLPFAQWAKAFITFAAGARNEEISLGRSYMHFRGITVGFDSTQRSYYVHSDGTFANQADGPTRSEGTRVAEGFLDEPELFEEALTQFAADDSYTTLGVYHSRCHKCEPDCPRLLFERYEGGEGNLSVLAMCLLSNKEEALQWEPGQ